MIENTKINNTDWIVIINPNAGNKKATADLGNISDYLKVKGLNFISVFTERKLDAIELAKTNIEKGYKNIIVVGGDGTINEVVNAIFHQTKYKTNEICLGVIMIGTGNDWGKMFNIPNNYRDAIDIIANKKTFLQDAGLVKYHCDNNIKKRYFINVAGIGFDAMVLDNANKKKEKGKTSKFSYLSSLLTSLIKHRHSEIEIIADNKSFKNNVFSINVGICRYSGGGMMQVPNAIPDDGLFDLTVINKIGKIDVVRSIKRLYDGSILEHPKVNHHRAKVIKIKSDTPIKLEVDGESLGHTPFEFTIIPRSINVIVAN